MHSVEVSEGGHVPETEEIVNEGELSVLLLDGEELLGAKQNRVLNLTILVPAHQTCVVPVSCVESGRWHHVSGRLRCRSACTVRGGWSREDAARDELVEGGREPLIGMSRKSGVTLRRSPREWAPCQIRRPCRRCLKQAM